MKSYFYLLSFTFTLIVFGSKAQNIYLYYPPVTLGLGSPGVHHDEVQITSSQNDMSRAISAASPGGPRAGKVTITDYTLTKEFDGASIGLMKLAVSDRPTEEIEIRYYYTSSGVEQIVLKIELAGVLISSFFTSSDGSRDRGCSGCPAVSESFSLNFEKYRITHFSKNPGGGVSNKVFMWDLITNTPTY